MGLRAWMDRFDCGLFLLSLMLNGFTTFMNQKEKKNGRFYSLAR